MLCGNIDTACSYSYSHPTPDEATIPDPPSSSLVSQVWRPLPENTHLEFKVGFTSCFITKVYATLCGLLNTGGGTMVYGVRDTDLNIVGVLLNKQYDLFMLSIDSIFHTQILRVPNKSLPPETITSSYVHCANGRILVMIHANDVLGCAGD